MQPKSWQSLRFFAVDQNQSSPRRWNSLVVPIALLLILGVAAFCRYGNLGSVRNEDIYNGFLQRGPEPSKLTVEVSNQSIESSDQRCRGKFVYIYPLPPVFNEELVDRCGRTTGNWINLCGKLDNSGLGPLVPPSENKTDNESLVVLEPANAWYRTEQFSLELLFHERMKEYSCLTKDASVASAFYIPYYGALDLAFTLFSPYLHKRDRLGQRLIGWLSGSPVWSKYREQRHFMVLGRITWDFHRPDEADHGWGSSLLSQPEFANVTKLLIERKTWSKDEIAIPYPTSFHPSSGEDMKLWQEKLRAGEPRREWLCTFVGSAKRSAELRGELARQCDAAKRLCRRVSCRRGSHETDMPDCVGKPEDVVKVLRTSIFCLQPPGDSPTRKGIFDSMLAGCIPVLFSNSSAYRQYLWHLPPDGGHVYSVFFDSDAVAQGHVNVISELARIVADAPRLRALQDSVVRLLPRLVYALPGHPNRTTPDAFDVALHNLLPTSPSTIALES